MGTLTKANDSSPWVLSHTINASGNKTFNLSTAGTFLDRNIGISITTPSASVSGAGGTVTATANASITTTPIVTPSIGGTITNASGITTTLPSGTNGTNYFTLDPGGSVTTTGVAKGTADASSATVTYTNAAGWIDAHSGTLLLAAKTATLASKTVNITPTIAAGTNYYLPITALTNTIISGTSNADGTTSGVDSFKVDVAIPAGYHSAGTITKTFTNLLPAISANAAGASHIRNGYKAYTDAGALLVGTMTEKSAATYYATTSALTIAANLYLAGALTIAALSSSNYSAANIKYNTTISVSNGSTNVFSAVGTFTASNTVSSGLTAAAAVLIRSGYSAWVNGSEVKGSMGNATATVSSTSATVTPTSSMSGNSNITLSDTNNGILITSTGGGSASISAKAVTNAVGYAASGATLGTATLTASSNTTTSTKYVSAVKLAAPSSGTRTFNITVPNGNTTDFITFRFTVDSSGNVTIDSP